jgi:hypothetical protein
VGHQGQGAGIDLLADAPDVQIGDAGFLAVGAGLDDLADLVDHRVVHLAVEQHLAGVADQPLRPQRHQHRADNAHQRIQPGPAVEPATQQRDDRQHRGRCIGDHMHIGGAQVQVVVPGVRVVMVRARCVCPWP